VKNTAKENLTKLIEKFERESVAGKIKEYNEEATKTAFIQPLLKDVLGWDVTNRDEVSPEEKISRGRVDYGLKVEGKIKVFVEAKPPKADLNKHIEQAIRYGYNRKGVPFVLLTDFEELKLFDVWVKPDSRNPRKGLKIDLRWDAYLKEFDKIWLLSKESVIKGELDKLLSVKAKDRLPVDKAILVDLKRWRESLAKDIFKNNHEKVTDANELKEITQRILDRIIFMRFCEDRNFVHRQPLKELFEERTETVGLGTMVILKEEFKHYNLIFDSDLFRPQDWESNLAIDFKVMKDIVLDTYNPYQFDVIPLEVLGNIYEQYLGYTIRLTDHQVKYELKPDVRKAGGVYYTPEYIVDYIVKNTVGKSLQELTPAKINKLRILDPACGSGSFLIRAYEEMLNYYKSQKKQSSRRHSERSEESLQKKLDLKHEETEPRLTIEEKSQILREHIFGVDIDEQAVEVTKLSLMLKMLEGEYGIIPGRAILPMLDKNIRCGNSLISGSPLGLKDLFGEDFYKTKPFDWKTEFRKIMVDEGGFDAIIGNPPYVFTRDQGFTKGEKEYFYSKYQAQSMQLNTFGLFVEKGLSLLKQAGIIGFITPNNWLTIDTFSALRKFILEKSQRLEIYNNIEKVFEDANVDTCILFSQKGTNPDVILGELNIGNITFSKRIKNKEISLLKEVFKISQFKESKYISIINKISIRSDALSIIAKVSTGLKAYQKGKGIPKQGENEKKYRIFHSNKIKNKTYKKYLDGKDVKRYYLGWSGEYLSYGKHLAEPRESVPFSGSRILVRQIPSKSPLCINAVYTKEEYLNDINSMIIFNITRKYHYNYILALINSRLISFWFDKTFDKFQRKIFPQFKVKELAAFPIRKIDFENSIEKTPHDDLVALVDVMLDLNKKIHTAKGSQKDQIQRQIDKTDKEIDNIVYKLYGITEEERKIIEGKE
jgi:adenine-specific DNA-methyltransferase